MNKHYLPYAVPLLLAPGFSDSKIKLFFSNINYLMVEFTF